MQTLPLLVLYTNRYQQREGFHTSAMLGGDVRSLIRSPSSLTRTELHSALCHIADYSLDMAFPPDGQWVHRFPFEEQ